MHLNLKKKLTPAAKADTVKTAKIVKINCQEFIILLEIGKNKIFVIVVFSITKHILCIINVYYY